MKKLFFIGTFAIVLHSVSISKAFAQDEAPKFRITHTNTYSGRQCGASSGIIFERGYLRVSQANAWVEIMLYLQRKDGSFQKIHLEKQGSGIIDLQLKDCQYTGNYYAFTCYAHDDKCKFPTEQEVIKKHQEIIATKVPEFKITRIIPNPQCPEEGVIFESGFVYSPTGGKVEVTVFLEKKEGGWRKQHFTHQGTGLLRLDIEDCNLTGKYKISANYANN